MQQRMISTHCTHAHMPGNVLQMVSDADGASCPVPSLSAPRKASQLTAPARINISMGGENASWRAPPIVTLAVQVDRFGRSSLTGSAIVLQMHASWLSEQQLR